ncbi:putative ATP-grasp-modified RiPP [Actinomadura sp. NPDC047616]|uniref:putative ATP-grasp-modified RiPP n=1 Tax=Actinomadura sp. NPDC047616 TaxID=3155914 RepID=UPI0033E9BC81
MKRKAFHAFRDAFCGRSLDRAREGAPTCHSVDRSHLLSSQRCTAPPNLSRRLTPTRHIHLRHPLRRSDEPSPGTVNLVRTARATPAKADGIDTNGVARPRTELARCSPLPSAALLCPLGLTRFFIRKQPRVSASYGVRRQRVAGHKARPGCNAILRALPDSTGGTRKETTRWPWSAPGALPGSRRSRRSAPSPPYTMVLDPETQTGLCIMEDGSIVSAKHRKSNRATETRTQAGKGDGGDHKQYDPDTDQDSEED